MTLKEQLEQQQSIEVGLRKMIGESEQLASTLRQEKHSIELELSKGTPEQLESLLMLILASQQLSHTQKEVETKDESIAKLKESKDSVKSQLKDLEHKHDSIARAAADLESQLALSQEKGKILEGKTVKTTPINLVQAN